MKKSHIAGKWALVTGSSRGIGQQIAINLAKLGCNVVVHGRKIANTEKTMSLLKDYSIKSLAVEGELSNISDIDKFIAQIRENTPGIDILYNNAAVMAKYNLIWEIPLDEWNRVFSINFYATLYLCNAFAPEMRKRKFGRIINLTSGMANEPSLSPYSVSKAAIDKFTKELAFELKDDNVLVNTLDPGWLKTDLGGQNAWFEVNTVIPGAIVPALFEDNGPSGQMISAQDYKYLTLDT